MAAGAMAAGPGGGGWGRKRRAANGEGAAAEEGGEKEADYSAIPAAFRKRLRPEAGGWTCGAGEAPPEASGDAAGGAWEQSWGAAPWSVPSGWTQGPSSGCLGGWGATGWGACGAGAGGAAGAWGPGPWAGWEGWGCEAGGTWTPEQLSPEQMMRFQAQQCGQWHQQAQAEALVQEQASERQSAASSGRSGGGGAGGGHRGAGASEQDDSERRLTGRIKGFYEMSGGGGYGFIDCSEAKMRFGRDVYIHARQMTGFKIGDSVSFTIVRNQKGEPQARNVMRTEDAVLLRAKQNQNLRFQERQLLAKHPFSRSLEPSDPVSVPSGLMDEDEARRFQESLKKHRL